MIVMSIPAQFQMEHFCRADLTALHLFVPYCRLPVRRKIANKVVRWRRFRDLRAGSCIVPTLSRVETMHSLPILCLMEMNIFQYDIVEMKIVKHDVVTARPDLVYLYQMMEPVMTEPLVLAGSPSSYPLEAGRAGDRQRRAPPRRTVWHASDSAGRTRNDAERSKARFQSMEPLVPEHGTVGSRTWNRRFQSSWNRWFQSMEPSVPTGSPPVFELPSGPSPPAAGSMAAGRSLTNHACCGRGQRASVKAAGSSGRA
jgi:hypothetical protein